MTAAWDRDEALLTIERLKKIHRSMDVFSPVAIVVDDAATLLHAADAEIARLQTQVEAAERMADALERIRPMLMRLLRGTPIREVPETLAEVDAALDAWDASREGGR